MEIKVVPKDGLLTIDPTAVDALLQGTPCHFHSHFHHICQNIYTQRTGKTSISDDLDDIGFGVIKNFASLNDAKKLRDSYSAMISKPSNSANTVITPNELREAQQSKLKTQITSMVLKAMENGVAELIENHLGCFFRIDHIQCIRTQHAYAPGISFRWHRDFEPMAQVHIILYLTACDEDSPATIFTTLEDTRRLADLGYHFPFSVSDGRVEDINSLIPKDTLPIKLHRPLLDIGDATIFDAARIMHRGVAPAGKLRDVVVLNILPSLNPWDQELNFLGKERLFELRNTMFTNPFELGSPNIEINHDCLGAPDWYLQSNYFA